MLQNKAPIFKTNTALWVSVAVLVMLPFLLFWRVWWFDSSQQRLFENGDFVEQNVAMRRFVAGEVRAGRLPLWDSYTYGGEPAIAGSLFAPYYPPGWWQFLFPAPFPDIVLPLEVIFHLAIGGIGTFLLARRLTGNTQAGLLSGVVFELSGWAMSYPMLQVGILETAVWLPWGLSSIEKGLHDRSWRWLAATALLLGVALLAGHPQTLMYLAYLSALYFVLRAVSRRVGWRFFLASGLLIGVGVLGIGAAQWLPGMEAYRYSPRLGLNYEAVSNGFSLHELWGVMRPNQGEWSPLYVGIIPLVLATIGVAGARGKRTLFWVGVAIIALAISLGANGAAYPIAYRLLPGFAIFRNQERIALLYMMAVAVLCGYGWMVLTQRRRIHSALFVTVLLLTIADLFRANGGVILERNEAGYYPPAPVMEYLRSVGDSTWRVSSEGNLPDGPNAGMVYHVRDIVGNGPLHVAALDTFVETVPEVRWWQLLNIQHVLTTRTFPESSPVVAVMESNLTALPSLPNGAETNDTPTLYQVFVGVTPVWITHEYEVATSQDEAIAHTAIVSDPHRRAILERPPTLPPAPISGEESATVTSFSAQEIITNVNLSSAALIIWSEVDYPGWVARVNGERLESYRAYGLLRAVALPAGQHEVIWSLEPPLVYIGIAVSVATLIGLLLIVTKFR